MKIREIPWYNRPGTRLKRKGVSSLSDAELLAIVFGRGDLQENAIDQANRILSEFNFHKLALLSYPEMNHAFLDQVKAMKIQAMFEIFRRTNRLRNKGFKTYIRTANDVFSYYTDYFRDLEKEVVYALFLDHDKRLIHEELVAIGALNSSFLHPHDLFQLAQKMGCSSIILAHKNGQKNLEPSTEDKRITKLLIEAGKLLKIEVMDHVIIGEDRYFSFGEKEII